MARARVQVLTAMGFGLFVAILVTIFPLYMFQIIDRVLTSRSVPTLTMLIMLAGGAVVMLGLLDALRHLILIRAGAALENRLTAPVGRILLTAAVTNPASALKQAADDMTIVRRFLSGRSMVHLCDLPWVPVFLLLILPFSLWVFLLAVGVAVVMALVAWLPGRVTRKRTATTWSTARQAEIQLDERLRHAPSLTVMGMMPAVLHAWRRQRDTMVRQDTSIETTLSILGAIAGFLRYAGVVLVVGLGAYLYVGNTLSSAALVAVTLLSDRAFAALETVTRRWRDLLDAGSARMRLRELFEASAPERERMPLPAPAGVVAVQQVMVAPPGLDRRPVLKGLSLSLEAGESLGIIGPSGAGKSALARTLVGLWPPMQGTVRLDGNDLRNWDPAQLGAHVGYLAQEIELLDGTVAANIARLGEVAADSVLDAARLAGVHETILRLPNGYDTVIGAGGLALPAGLRQRIGLARALYGSPALVVLDEPNAFLDSEGDQALATTLQALYEAGRTVVVVTQKPALLSSVQTVLVLRDGQIEMMGPRQTVMARFARPAGAAGSGAAQLGGSSGGGAAAAASQDGAPRPPGGSS